MDGKLICCRQPIVHAVVIVKLRICFWGKICECVYLSLSSKVWLRPHKYLPITLAAQIFANQKINSK